MPSFEWIEKLAKDELKSEETGQVDYYGTLDQTILLEEQTKGFLRELKSIAQEMTITFNAYRGDRHALKVFHISNSESDFMVFRNSLKLIFSYEKPGEISISFLAVRAGLLEEKMKHDQKQGDVIRATLGPFHDAIWHFRDHLVNPQTLMRYYLTEFIKNSVS